MPSGAEGSPPPPPRRGASGGRGGTVPRARTATPRLAPRVGMGSRPGSAFLPAPAPSSHKRQRAPGWDNRAAGLFSERGAWGRQEENPGRGDYNKRGSIPERPLPRENFLFLGCRDREKQAGSFYARYRPDLRGVLPARLALCGVSELTIAGAG